MDVALFKKAPKYPNDPGLAVAVQAARLDQSQTATAMATVAKLEDGILASLDGDVPLVIVAGSYPVIVTSSAVVISGKRFTYPEIARVGPMQHTYKKFGIEVVSHEALNYSDVSPEYAARAVIAWEMTYEAAQTGVAAIKHQLAQHSSET